MSVRDRGRGFRVRRSGSPRSPCAQIAELGHQAPGRVRSGCPAIRRCDRRGASSCGPWPRDDGSGNAPGAPGTPRIRRVGQGAARALPPAQAAEAAGGPERAGLCPAECPQATRGADRAGCRAARGSEAGSGDSARWFDGWHPGVAGVGATDPPPPVAAARSWLLCVGWLRYGRIDPTEVPGAHWRRAPRGPRRPDRSTPR